MIDETHVWAVVLAGGEGRRLHSLTTTASGTVPKQYCSLHGGPTLLQEAYARASSVVDPARVCAIVAKEHRHWWAPLLEPLPRDNVIVQPRNLGTGMGVLYSVLQVLARDPLAHIVFFPSDHYVRDEWVLKDAVRVALAQLSRDVRHPVLLGFEPEAIDTELGYILPGESVGFTTRRVMQFIEKPDAQACRTIIGNGGLSNGFIVAASANALLDLYLPRYAATVLEMQVKLAWCTAGGIAGAASWARFDELYEHAPEIDFSRDILQDNEQAVRVVKVPPCGWSDLGTPRGLETTLRTQELSSFARTKRDVINLAARLAQASGIRDAETGRAQPFSA